MAKLIDFDEFLIRSKNIHGHKYDYSSVNYINTVTKIEIICPVHGVFTQLPEKHINGQGCKECGRQKAKNKIKDTKETFIQKALKKHGKKFDYSQVIYINSQIEISICCPIHGIFNQRPATHLFSKYGCQKCGYENRELKSIFKKGRRLNKMLNNDIFIQRAKEMHGDKYDYSLVKYTGSKNKLKIICKEHGIFEQIAGDHYRFGCKKCARQIVANKLKKNTNYYIEKHKKIHGERYDYSLVNYINNKTKIILVCPKHGRWETVPASMHGCHNCSIEESALRYAWTTEKFIEEAKKIHGNKYDYSQVIYKNNSSKIIIGCAVHGFRKQRPSKHLRNGGCDLCSPTHLLTTEEFIQKAKKTHGDKYDYSLVNYINNKTEIKIICLNHGVFEQKPASHLIGNGCQICKESKGERKIRLYLKNNKKNIQYQHPIRKIGIFDFISYNKNQGIFAIEYNGKQHYYPCGFGSKNKKQIKKNFKRGLERDRKKELYCKANNIPLLIIPYWDYDHIEAILDDYFAGRTPTFSPEPEIVKKYKAVREKIVKKFDETLAKRLGDDKTKQSSSI
jgi:DNA-dependent RNA polymerase auxiliary subunit epsilon